MECSTRASSIEIEANDDVRTVGRLFFLPGRSKFLASPRLWPEPAPAAPRRAAPCLVLAAVARAEEIALMHDVKFFFFLPCLTARPTHPMPPLQCLREEERKGLLYLLMAPLLHSLCVNKH